MNHLRCLLWMATALLLASPLAQAAPSEKDSAEGLREALRKKKVTPAQIAKFASDARVWKTMEPYVSALTADG